PDTQRFRPLLDASLFDEPYKKENIRFKKPIQTPEQPKFTAPKNLKPIKKSTSGEGSPNLVLGVGDIVEHQRFGKGKVIAMEGKGADQKAEITFENGDTKKLLLRFAKLDVLA